MKKKKIMSETLQTIFYTTGIITLGILIVGVCYVVLRDIESSKQPIIQNQKQKKQSNSSSDINTGIQTNGNVGGNVVQNNNGGTSIKVGQKTNL